MIAIDLFLMILIQFVKTMNQFVNMIQFVSNESVCVFDPVCDIDSIGSCDSVNDNIDSICGKCW